MRTVAVAAFAMAACLTLAVGLARRWRHDDSRMARGGADRVEPDVDQRIRSAAQDLVGDVMDRAGEDAASRVRDVTDLGGAKSPGLNGLSWDDVHARKPGNEDAVPPADADRFARGVLSLCDRTRAASGREVVPALKAMLIRERRRCPEGSSCYALLSQRLAQLETEERK
jgi:hypothetical protein